MSFQSILFDGDEGGIDAVHGVGVAGLAECHDPAVPNADVAPAAELLDEAREDILAFRWLPVEYHHVAEALRRLLTLGVELAGADPAPHDRDREAQPLRGLVNLVGGFAAGDRIHETPVSEFDRQFLLNLRPTYLTTQASLRHMVAGGGGSIVCVGTRAALRPFSGAAGYAASKAAVIAFAKAVAVEYADDGVRCNVILPSVIDTPANRAAMPDAKHERWVKPAEIAGVVAHLLSADARPTSGAAVPVYGRA